MKRNAGHTWWLAGTIFCGLSLAAGLSSAQQPSAKPDPAAADDVLGEIVVTGRVQEHIPKIAVLRNFGSAYEDVIVRSVVRRDLELSGLFELIPDEKAPDGDYGFEDKVNLGAWQSLGAEAVVKVAARSKGKKKIEVLGLAYFPSSGSDPVYETKLVVKKENARITAHRITDDLLGALTGFPGGFASRFAFSAPRSRNLRVFTVDSDGYGPTSRTDPKDTAIGPTFGPNGELYYSRSRNYSPFRVVVRTAGLDGPDEQLDLPFSGSVYSTTFSPDKTKVAFAVAENGSSHIYVGNADGSDLTKVSRSELATHPAFSSEGHLAWVGGAPDQSSQRIFVDGKAVSPASVSASAPTFCSNENGTFLVYSVSVGGGRQDLVLSSPEGKGLTRLTQNQGSNFSPACSPDGRLLAFFSTRNDQQALYVLSLKRWTTKKVVEVMGQGLRWEPLSRQELLLTGAPKTKAAISQASLGPACGLAPAPANNP